MAIRIKAQDEYGNVLPFYHESLILEAKGPIELIGGNVISLKGVWVEHTLKLSERKAWHYLLSKMPTVNKFSYNSWLAKKNQKKFGDDSQVSYKVTLKENEHIGDTLGVVDVLLPAEGGSELL